MILWRISRFENLEGLGGIHWPGRWHPAGQPIVYLADHPASAMLETLVHLETLTLPATFTLLEIKAPDPLVLPLASQSLSSSWQKNLALTQALGHAWLEQAVSAVLQVPSAIVPEGKNFLLNPRHPEAHQCQVSKITTPAWDPRLRA